MRFATLTCLFATLVALAVGCLFILPAAAHAAPAETGQITSPTPGTALTTGKPVTAKAVVTDACTATLTLRTPAGDKTNLAKESGNPTCLGEITLTGTFTPDKPGDYALTVIGSVPLSEVSLTATAAPTPTPTVTETVTATPTASQTPSASATPTPTETVTKTATPSPKASATPKKSATAKPRATTTVKVTDPAPATAQQPTVINNVPAIPTAAPSGTDPNTVTFPTAAAPVTTVTAQPDYTAAWLAFQKMSADTKDDGSIWDAILRVIGFMGIVAMIAAVAWIGIKVYRKRGRHH
ncbi:hypothetical protein AB0F17_43195 [Nonomuraea sp. NPDC026600]|uniref:hypothetical protein n=1 Tax=Nonomuraea sp. NPDC026600 TaxID=3155363 RepID=UPI0033F0CCBC